MVMTHVPETGSEPSVHVTLCPTFPQEPALATTPVIEKKAGAGIVSVTWRLRASDGPLFVTVIV